MATTLTLKLVFFALIGVAVALEIAADILFKKWSLTSKNTLLAIGLALYFVGIAFWAISIKFELLSKAVSVFTILNMIAVVLAGVLYFKEDLSIINKIGIALGILSVVLIEI